MKDISKIRNRGRVVETVDGSVAVRGDPQKIAREQLFEQAVTIQQITNKKRKQINQLDSEIEAKRVLVTSHASDIVEKAQQEAKKIIDGANAVKYQAEGLISRAEKLEKALNDRGLTLDDKKKELDTTSSRLDKRLAVLKADENILSDQKTALDAKIIRLKAIFDDVTSLYLLTIEKVGIISELGDSVVEKVSQALQKASIIYKEAANKEKEVTIDKELLIKRNNELDNKGKWLADKEDTLKRSAREVERKLKYVK